MYSKEFLRILSEEAEVSGLESEVQAPEDCGGDNSVLSISERGFAKRKIGLRG